MNPNFSQAIPSNNFPNKSQYRIEIPESARESLMSMMKEIMEKSQLSDGELHYIPEESIEESLVVENQNFTLKQGLQMNLNQIKPRQVQKTSNSVATQEFSKLLEITQRCRNYYNSFFRQKESELQTIEKTFNDLNTNLNTAFEEIISELVKKQKELKEFLLKKYEEIMSFRNQQDQHLKYVLRQIQGLPHPTSQSQQLSFQLHTYASTLNDFYTVMEDIQKSNFKEMVEQSVNFINNLVTEEIRVTLYEKIPSRLTEKHMIRQNSKDFLTQSRENLQEPRTDTFAILDIDSFTKLFFDNQDRFEEKIEKEKHVKAVNQIFSKTGSNEILNPTMQNKSKIQQKTSLKKKQTSISPTLSPSRTKPSVENGQNQSQLELIRKISYQQSNRSAKIKGYMVTFQDPKLMGAESQSKNQNTCPKTSKSPSNVSKTPSKTNKSTQKKPLISSVSMNASNQQKLKNSSLKASRTSTVSEFKVPSTRRQSIANQK